MESLVVSPRYDNPEVMLGREPDKDGSFTFNPDFWFVYNLLKIVKNNRERIMGQWQRKKTSLSKEETVNHFGRINRYCTIIMIRGLKIEYIQELENICREKHEEMTSILPDVAEQVHHLYLEYKCLEKLPKPKISDY